MATRISTVFASLKVKTYILELCVIQVNIHIWTGFWIIASFQEFPTIRYRVKGSDGSSESTFRDSIPKKLAEAIWDYIKPYKTSIPKFPQTETCELLILDRSVDLVILVFLIFFIVCNILLSV